MPRFHIFSFILLDIDVDSIYFKMSAQSFCNDDELALRTLQ